MGAHRERLNTPVTLDLLNDAVCTWTAPCIRKNGTASALRKRWNSWRSAFAEPFRNLKAKSSWCCNRWG
ncbi:hypothetical protein M8494_15925 [Serratia ureilytica]